MNTCKTCKWMRWQQSATERGDFCMRGICNTAINYIDGMFYKDPDTFGCIHHEKEEEE